MRSIQGPTGQDGYGRILTLHPCGPDLLSAHRSPPLHVAADVQLRSLMPYKVGQKVWVPWGARGRSGASPEREHRSEDHRGLETQGGYFDRREDLEISKSSLHADVDVGVLVLRLGDFKSEYSLLDPLARSVQHFMSLLVPLERLALLGVRSLAELTAWWSLIRDDDADPARLGARRGSKTATPQSPRGLRCCGLGRSPLGGRRRARSTTSAASPPVPSRSSRPIASCAIRLPCLGERSVQRRSHPSPWRCTVVRRGSRDATWDGVRREHPVPMRRRPRFPRRRR